MTVQQPDLGSCVPSAISLEMLHPPCHPVCRLVLTWLKTREESSIVKICEMTLAPIYACQQADTDSPSQAKLKRELQGLGKAG
ncbi:hypothetical protein BDL97_03G143600 [Sphagnum fallax]|nr:hypothetical protein BDL97_03G143600 [Sphagnum fallax]